MMIDTMARFLLGSTVVVSAVVVVPQAAPSPESDLIAWSVRALLAGSLALNGYYLARTAKAVTETEKQMQSIVTELAVLAKEWEVWREVLRDEYGGSGNRRSGQGRRQGDDDNPPDITGRIDSQRRLR